MRARLSFSWELDGFVRTRTRSTTAAAPAAPKRPYDVYAKGLAASQASRAAVSLFWSASERQSFIFERAPTLNTMPATRAAAPTPAITHSVAPIADGAASRGPA